MALKLRISSKDIKKSSYYVWFLGAKESKGLRGSEYILPVIRHLEERERDVEPFKVTLQVSPKGLKIVQNVTTTTSSSKNSKPKSETIKHFIPHNTITCVYQVGDVIACILLLFNPVTKCPLHVHAYRCDSLETASLLKQQLTSLIERPENQKKFAEIEGRLKPPVPVTKGAGATKEPRKKLTGTASSLGSDTGTSTRESESSEERFAVENTRVSTLYDSVAAELREKLNKNKVPILLPPRDYDTVHRQKGNLTGIELRRCLNANIVGQNAKARHLESSGGSSGIGSDHPPSPDSPDAPDTRFHALDNHSTDDEDWHGDPPTDTSIYLSHQSPPHHHNTNRDLAKYLEKSINNYSDNKYLDRQRSSLERLNYYPKPTPEKPMKYFEDDGFDEVVRHRPRRYADPPIPKARQKYSAQSPRPFYPDQSDTSPRDRFQDAKEKYSAQSPRPFYPDQSDTSPRDRFQDAKEKYSAQSPRPFYPDQSDTSPRDRFQDAKDKFLSMEKEMPISPVITREKTFLKRHESMLGGPKPAPRHLERYDKYDPKRRSLFSLVEEERRQSSNDIARELKRRSYMDEMANREFSKSLAELEQANQKKGYRHSYAEPKLRAEAPPKKHFDMLHRTNSVSTNARVGIASLHPY